MTVIADITVPSEAFELGRILRGFPIDAIEFEPVVPLRESLLPLVWVTGGDRDAIETDLLDLSEVEAVQRLVVDDDDTLFEVTWHDDLDGIVQPLIESNARILEASGRAEAWDFRLRFPSHESLSLFNMAATDEDIPITLRHLYNPVIPTDQSPLSPQQQEALELAYHRGYFEVPRRVTLSKLADEMEISDSALSQRIRRGTATVVERSLFTDEAQ